jgi:hypothetical protein
MSMRLALVAAFALIPATAAACAACIDSAWGTRGFSWPFVGMMLAPFAVVGGLVGIARHYVRTSRRSNASGDVDDAA